MSASGFSRLGISTEVSGDHFGVTPNLIGRTLGDRYAMVEHQYALADSHDQFHIVLDQ